ncbi:MAG TPA: sigma-70 family RNA polymerase sigma factor [Ktedonobacterales bacterium]|nr:sigma-70 family RNA polymerase sigma factor [Ktedonobacterales bacterium]
MGTPQPAEAGEAGSGRVVAAARPHDDGAFARLVIAHTGAMLRVAGALVGAADAEDAAQEALVHAWRAWGLLRDEGALRAWLLRITVNVCRQWQRGSFGRRARLTGPLPEEGADVVGLEDLAMLTADAGTSDHTSAMDLRHAVNHLPPDFRVAVVLRYYAGMEPSEIGAALGILPVTVRTRLHRALLMLRERLARPRADLSQPEESER